MHTHRIPTPKSTESRTWLDLQTQPRTAPLRPAVECGTRRRRSSAVLCYRCGRATVRSWVVEEESSFNLGKRFYKCPRFHESDPDACRFGFMWHDEYRPILERIGVLPPTGNQMEIHAVPAPNPLHFNSIVRAQGGAGANGRHDGARPSAQGGQIARPNAEAGLIMRALLAISIVQLLFVLLILSRI